MLTNRGSLPGPDLTHQAGGQLAAPPCLSKGWLGGRDSHRWGGSEKILRKEAGRHWGQRNGPGMPLEVQPPSPDSGGNGASAVAPIRYGVVRTTQACIPRGPSLMARGTQKIT